jgi:2-dehydropantoate 2-reductase
VYIVAMIESPGIIKKKVCMKTIFGSKISSSKLNVLQSIFENANIESYFVENRRNGLGKVYFISALASATTYLNVNIGGILNNPENKAIYSSLLNKITAVAIAKG